MHDWHLAAFSAVIQDMRRDGSKGACWLPKRERKRVRERERTRNLHDDKMGPHVSCTYMYIHDPKQAAHFTNSTPRSHRLTRNLGYGTREIPRLSGRLKKGIERNGVARAAHDELGNGHSFGYGTRRTPSPSLFLNRTEQNPLLQGLSFPMH